MSDFTAINGPVKEEDIGDAPEAPKTPSKRKNGATQGGTAKKSKGDTPKSTTKNIKSSKIPETFDELAEEDKMMIGWKERGEPWSVINQEWKRITGNMPGKSTLPNRYPRLKANLACVASDDVAQMMKSEVAISQQIEAEYKDALTKKWARIAKHMEDAGIQTYSALTLEKQYKKIKASGSGGATGTPMPETSPDEATEG